MVGPARVGLGPLGIRMRSLSARTERGVTWTPSAPREPPDRHDLLDGSQTHRPLRLSTAPNERGILHEPSRREHEVMADSTAPRPTVLVTGAGGRTGTSTFPVNSVGAAFRPS